MSLIEKLREAANNGKGTYFTPRQVPKLLEELTGEKLTVTIATPDIVAPTLQPYEPAIGVRAPWLAEDGTIAVDLLFAYADSPETPGHELAVGLIREVGAAWDQHAAPDDFNPNGKDPTNFFQHFAPGNTLEEIKRIVSRDV